MHYREPEYRRRAREKNTNNQIKSERARHEAAQDARIEKIIGSIDRIVKQIEGYGDPESCENRGKRLREWLEILALTAAAFVGLRAISVASKDAEGQRTVMQNQLNTMQTQANAATYSAKAAQIAADAAKRSADANYGQLEEMQTSSRAWVGSIGAQVDGTPSIGTELAITIQYQNLGREPARNFSNRAINGPPYSVSNTSFNSGLLTEAFTDNAQACLLLPDANGGQIVYPSSGAIGGASYVEHLIVDKSLKTKEAVAGDATIVIEGCFTYYTAKAVRHSAFCYTWNAKTNAAGHTILNFCPTGNDGD